MAMMKLVCGQCGGSLGPQDSACPQCGSTVERPAGVEQGGGVRCKSCGHSSREGSTFCESCGTRLATPARSQEKKWKEASLRSYHIPAVVVALLFGGWALVDDLGRDIPPRPDHTHAESPAQPPNAALREQVQQLQRMVEAHPDDDEMLLRFANALQDYSVHDHEALHRAVEAYERYLRRNPADENARVDLGICYFDLSRHDTSEESELLGKAITEMKTVAESNPRHQAAAFNLGIVLLNAGQAEESTEWFRKAATIDPTSTMGVRATRLLEDHSFSE